jgi:hypothetical protein
LVDAGAALELAKVWRANSGEVLERCTGERYRVYGSLYGDQNQNGKRDADEVGVTEAYTETTTYVELYAQNGAHRLAVTYPNHAGIFTFDITYDAQKSPYTIKLQNSTRHHPLFFSAGMAGPYDLDMIALPAKSVVIHGALFVDSDSDGVQAEDESFAAISERTTATIDLYAPNGAEPLATATSDHQGNFLFYLEPPTTTLTYELRVRVESTRLRTTPIHHLTISPTTPLLIPYAIALDSADLPIIGQDQTPNPTPSNLRVITRTGSIVLHWTTPHPLRHDSVFEILYASQPGAPYQSLGVTAFAQTTSYTIFDLPSLSLGGEHSFAVRARTRADAHYAFWSGYSNEVTISIPPPTLLFLPVISR